MEDTDNTDKPKGPTQLRTIEDLKLAHEYLFRRQDSGSLDSKSADAMNTTLRGAVYLNATLPLAAAKLFVQAKIKKISIPEGLLPLPMKRDDV